MIELISGIDFKTIDAYYRKDFDVLFKDMKHAYLLSYEQKSGLILVKEEENVLLSTKYISDGKSKSISIIITGSSAYFKRFHRGKKLIVFLQYVDFLMNNGEFRKLSDEVKYSIENDIKTLPDGWSISLDYKVIY